MIRLRKLNIRGFRGARFDLPLEFTKDHRSVSIFGENATGKSTITDALEWFLLGKVEHLWHEDCKEEALRNVLIGDKDASTVSIEFSDSQLNGIKTLAPDLKTATSNTSAAFKLFLEKAAAERIFLRHTQITNIVAKTKGEKREWIAKIIGYQAITDFRSHIQSTLNALQRDAAYTTAKHVADNAQNELFQLVGGIIASEKDVFAKANELIKPYGLDTTISNRSTYQEALAELRSRISHPEDAKIKIRLDELKKKCDAFVDQVGAVLNAKDAFVDPYNELAKDKSAVSQLNIGQFLKAGKAVIEAGHFTDQQCPLCLTPYDLEKLREEVEARIQEIVQIQGRYEEAETLKATFIQAANALIAACKPLAADYGDLEKFKTLTGKAAKVLAALNSWVKTTNDGFIDFRPVMLLQQDADAINGFATLAKAQAKLAKSESESLDLSEQERRLIETIDQVRDLERQFDQYQVNSATVHAFEKQILSLSAIFDKFVPVQNAALQSVLDTISEDVGTYYATLHPKEDVDKVRLSVVGAEGVEFEYQFHGRTVYPPAKYLSESHLNSLGICLFLASARLFNSESRFLVLDDIVTSFDLGHRRHLLRLIKDQFSDWQIILLTHERFWFEMIQKELAQSGWLFREVEWDADNGIQLSPSAADLKALIEEKRKKHDVSNDIRKLLEASLKEICYALEVKVAFRFNEENERRMSGELLSELRATVNRKCPPLKGHASFANLEGSNLIVTVGSHDNPAETITGGDIDVALGDIGALTDHFTCQDCGRYVEAKQQVHGQDKITCRCGKKQLEWKP
jgi:DNA repair exonuclease SbcCD ATPase subunit